MEKDERRLALVEDLSAEMGPCTVCGGKDPDCQEGGLVKPRVMRDEKTGLLYPQVSIWGFGPLTGEDAGTAENCRERALKMAKHVLPRLQDSMPLIEAVLHQLIGKILGIPGVGGEADAPFIVASGPAGGLGALELKAEVPIAPGERLDRAEFVERALALGLFVEPDKAREMLAKFKQEELLREQRGGHVH